MNSIRTYGLLAAMGFLIAIPAARAQGDANTKSDVPSASTTTTTTTKVNDSSKSGDQCIDQCVDDCAQKCPASSTGALKKHKASTHGTTGMNTNKTYGSSTTAVNEKKNAGLDEDAIRAEERARAAEEFRAQNEAMMEEHRAELDRVRSEERELAAKKADADVAAARADEDKKYRTEISHRDQELVMARRAEPVIKPAVLTPVGVYGFVGGGATNFTQPNVTGATSVGGYWDARLGIGTRSILGGEIAYEGGARDITALGLNSSAYLVNNGLEGVARLNVPITTRAVLIEPYTFGGIGWQHYSLGGVTTNTSSVDQSDDIMTVPMGLGLQFGFSGFTLDARATYRHAFFSDLLGNSSSSFDSNSLNSWTAGGAIGFEF